MVLKVRAEIFCIPIEIKFVFVEFGNLISANLV